MVVDLCMLSCMRNSSVFLWLVYSPGSWSERAVYTRLSVCLFHYRVLWYGLRVCLEIGDENGLDDFWDWKIDCGVSLVMVMDG